MNRNMNTLFLSLLISGSVLADDAGILRCRNLSEAPARLACYDALVVPATDAKRGVSKPAVQPETRPSPAATPMSSPAVVAAAPQKIEQFGLENRVNPDTLDAIESYIPGRFEGWEAKSNIKLANGQVWQVSDDSSRYLTLNDPKVRIRRGALGTFYLEFEKTNYSPRVRRVQ